MSFAKNKYLALVRREYWEHRSLWMAPVIVAGVMLLLPLSGRMNNGIGFNPGEDPAADTVLPALFGQATMIGVLITLGGVAALAAFGYLLDCLYGERKDRSILFWKSLPTSDAETVLAKIVVALVLTPIFVMLLAMLVQPLLLGMTYLRIPATRVAFSASAIWSAWQLLPDFAMTWFYAMLWYAPFTAWLLLASVLARRVPLMYALMPPLALMLLEGIVLQGNRVATFLGERLIPWIRDDWAWDFNPSRGALPGMMSPDWSTLYANPSLWIGLALAAGMVYIVIRLRRYRDET